MRKIDLLDTDATAAALNAGECPPTEVRRYLMMALILAVLRLEIPLPRPLYGSMAAVLNDWLSAVPALASPQHLETATDQREWQLAWLKLGLFLAAHGVALALAYWANRRGDGRHFWWRALALYGPVGTLTGILALFAYPIIFQPLAQALMERQGWGGFGPHGDSYVYWHGLVFLVLMEAFFTWRYWRAMTLAALPHPRKTPA